MCNIRSIKVILVVVRALGSKKTKELQRRTGSCYKHSITAKTGLLGRTPTLRKVLDFGKGLWKRSWGEGGEKHR